MTTRSPPITRKKTAALRVYEDYPASPSEPATVVPHVARAMDTASSSRIDLEPASRIAMEHASRTAVDTAPRTEPAPRIEPAATALRERAIAGTPSVCSRRSTASAIARIKQAEYEAEEQLVNLRREELRMQAELIRKKLAVDVATIREDTDRESVHDNNEAEQRVHNWLTHSQSRGEMLEPDTDPESRHPASNNVRDKQEDRIPPHKVTFEAPRTPACQPEERITRLTDALEKMARSRVPPRQTLELPSFSGDHREWLPFKAAMRDSTNLLNLSPTENLARLRTCLRGEAKQAVSALLYTATDPSIIMRTLEQCYGRPEMIIDQALEEIKKLPRVGTSASELNAFAIKVQNVVTMLTCIDEQGYLMNPTLARSITEKLSPHLRSRWCDFARDLAFKGEAEVTTLSRFLMKEADGAMRYAYTNTPNVRVTPAVRTSELRRERTRKPVYATTTHSRNENECFCCGGRHRTTECGKLAAMPLRKRWEWAKETRICFKCLNSKHKRILCKYKRCGVNECRHPHHALLHTPMENEAVAETTADVETATTASARMSTDSQRVLLKVCPVEIVGGNGRIVRTHALFDEGSTITLIDEELATSIGARGPARALNIIGATASQQEPSSRAVRLEVRGQDRKTHPITARTVKHLTLGSQTIGTDLLRCPHLRKLQPEFVCYENAKPRLLIGADNWHLIVTRKLLIGSKRQPVASLTQLGWIIHGTTPHSVVTNRETVLHVHTQQQCMNDQLSGMVKAHFDIDALGISINVRKNPSEERALGIFNSTARRVNGHYEVGLPWVTDHVTMPPSYDMAFSRLRNIERKMDRIPEFKAAYTSQIESLLQKGYAEESSHEHTSSTKEWYLPHFAVTNPNKPGKVRVVFDAAARSSGTCLNDVLLDGPDLLHSLYKILFGFRTKRVAVTADIREMFLRIKIRKEDRAVQQFLWRGDNRTTPPRKYVMTSMIFGARSSPFLAHSVRNENAASYKETHPHAYAAITERHYMDDWVDSFDSEELAARAISEVKYVHAQAGFELASWGSNREELLRDIPTSHRACESKELATSTHPYDKALGLLWIPGTDELGFNTLMTRVPAEVKNLTRAPTKREALGAVMSLFDPLGLLSPYTITAKITLQELWRKRIAWDDPLPTEEATMYAEWLADLPYIADIRLPRCYDVRREITQRQLHVFCDASEQAYATVAYWRFINRDGNVHVSIVAGKAKVAPLKAQSIPRMELQAALIGARLASDIMAKHPWDDACVIYWTDSTTVLQWIRNGANKYTPYVAHRLSEIAELTNPEQWRWVPTTLNVADDATRPGHTQLTNASRWFTGPEFLYGSEQEWPVERVSHDPVLVVRVGHVKERTKLIEFTRFSSYERLVRALAYALLFVDKCRKRSSKLSLNHLRESERLLVRETQRESFPTELKRLERQKQVERGSRLYNLDPMYGDDQLIRLNSRINAANVPTHMKNPPILDGNSYIAKLIIRREHLRNNHAGREQLVNNLRQHYWILRLRPAVRNVLKSCVNCKLRRAPPVEPVKGNLPAARLQAYTRPFTYCGIDCYGPIWVTVGRRREKRWGMLFTCLVTRAIHIELIASLSTDSALMAIRRMAARRGIPRAIVSDNGTNFHGADVELRKAYIEWLPAFENYALSKRIEWRFIDPGAPNQGGAWERLIRSIKSAMLVILNDRAPKEEILQTLTTEIEHTINSRPLTHVPVNPDDPEALTPNHFLLGSATGLPYVGPCDAADRRSWRAAQALANSFWARWVNEYLPTLAPRGDNRKAVSNVKPGDLVVIADGLLPRNVWPRGYIERVYTGPDGVVRSAEVRTKGGIFRRPVRRLVVLPMREGGCEDLRRGETVADTEP